MKKVSDWLLGLLLPFIIIVAWYLAKKYLEISDSILPSMNGVRMALIELLKEGTLQSDLKVSFARVLRGYLCSVIIGGLLGVSMGMSSKMHTLFHLTITCIRQIPIIAWIPLIIMWFGIEDLSKTVVIALGTTFIIAINLENGISGTPKGLIEVASIYKLSKWKTFVKVYLPHALPSLFVGLRLGLSTSWMAVVAAELMAANSGIGFRISYSRSLLRADIVVVCMIVIALIGIILDRAISLLFLKITPWEYRNKE